MLIAVVTSLRTIGEPATVDELVDAMRPRLPQVETSRLKSGVQALLREYAEPASATPFACPPFRRVLLGRAEAWAFSKAFRTELTNSGLEIRLRPLAEDRDA
ncbi:hypothetical protein [Phenylobacterium sp.]|uniref:hypothetical protein n=1 Tax=Phenylobacterium sp. TaxID=1871053 RepID=UPI00289DC2BF|nr:hypothetical protein [Phenylobacterium sp.]